MPRHGWEPPLATRDWGWRYHHTGVPTTERRSDERYLPQFKLYVSGFPESPYGVEFMRFEPDCPLPDLIKTVPHVAFEVENLEAALEGRDVLLPPGAPSTGVRAAMIVHNGAPIELIEFARRA